MRLRNRTGLAARLDRVQGHRCSQAAFHRGMSPDLDGEPGSKAFEDLDAASGVVGDRDQDLDLTRTLDERIEVTVDALPLGRPGRREQRVDERDHARS
jgi:hypothetical protein